MRIILSWLDHLRRTTADGLPQFCSALVSQFQDIAAAANVWAQKDHNDDGTHQVVRIGGTRAAPDATPARISLYWDGVNLKWVKPDGSTGTIV
jgi:hypothetical protein